MLNNFFKESVITSGSKLIIAMIGFVLIYVYTHRLSIENYGLLELLLSFAQIIMVFFTLGLPSAFTRFYLLNLFDKNELVSNIYTIHFLLSIIISVVILVVFKLFIFLYDWQTFSFSLITIVLFKQIFLSSSKISERYFLAEKKFIIYSSLNILYFSSLLLISYYSLSIYQNSIYHLLVSQASVTFVYSLLLYTLLKNKIKFHLTINLKLHRNILKFALPFIPSGIAYFVLTMSDRFYIEYFLSLEDVAIYSIGYRVASLVQLVIIMPLSIVFTQYVFDLAKDNKKKEIIEVYDFVFKLYILASVLLVLSAPLIVHILAPVEYKSSFELVKLFVFSLIIYGLNFFYVSGANISGNTKYQMYAMIVGMLINLILNYFFIQYFGMVGAIYASIISFTVISMITYYYSQKFYFLEYNIIKNIIFLMILYGFFILLDNSFYLFYEFDIQIRIVLFLLFSSYFIRTIVNLKRSNFA